MTFNVTCGTRMRLFVSAAAVAASFGATSGSAQGMEPIEGRPQPVENTTGEPIRIAMIGFANNPYWVSVQEGVEAANEVLASQNAEVNWIVAGANIDVPTVNQAVNATAIQGYDGVGFFIAGEGNCPTIEALTAQGMSVGAYNTLFDCVEQAGGVINYAQDQHVAGQNAAKALLEEVGDASGSVGIIVSQFTAPGSELRRQGFVDGLEGSNLTLVGEGVEARDSAATTFNAANDYLTSTSDLVAIYATAGGPFGAAEAVKAAGREDEVRVIGYDFTPENIAAIRDGSMFGVTGQDAFGQGYDVAIALYNHAVTGEKPEQVLQPAVSLFMTQENVDQLDPAVLPLGFLPTE